MKKVVLLIICLLILGIGYKTLLLNKYYVEKINLNTDGIFSRTITIKYQENNNPTFKYENMIIKDYFSSWPKKEDFYVSYNELEEVEEAILISKMDQYYLLLNSNSFNFDLNDDDKLFTEEDRNKFIRDNNINSDIDLYNYIKENYYAKSNIFNSIKRIKQNYIINNFVSLTSITTDETEQNSVITLIDGDINGYIYNVSDKIKEIHILYNNEQYIITILKRDIVSDDNLIDLLESIKFENN